MKHMMKDHNKEPVKGITKLSAPLYRWWAAQRYLLPALLALAMVTALPPESAWGQNKPCGGGAFDNGNLTVKVISGKENCSGTVLFTRTYSGCELGEKTITVEYGSLVCIEAFSNQVDYYIRRRPRTRGEVSGGDNDVLKYDYPPAKFPGKVPVLLGESYGGDGIKYGVEDLVHLTLNIVVSNTQVPQITSALPAVTLMNTTPHTFNANAHFTDTGIGETSTTVSPDKLTYKATSAALLIAGVSVDEVTGVVSVTARTEGSTDIMVTATDLAGNATTQTFTVTVDLPPVPGTINDLFLTFGGETGTSDFAFGNVDADTQYTVRIADENIATAEIAGTTMVTVTPVGVGTTTATVNASDGGSLNVDQTFDVTVLPSPPVIDGGSSKAVSAAEHQVSVTTVSATGSGVVSYSVSGGADRAFFGIDASSGVLTFNTPPDFESTHAATYTVEVTAVVTESGLENESVQTITVTVIDAPDITSPSENIEHELNLPENTKRVVQMEATHPSTDGELVWSLSEHDSFLFEISQAGVLSFKDAFVPDYENPRNTEGILGGEVTAEGTFAQNQEYSVVVTATNDVGSDTQLIEVTTTNVFGSPAPVITALSPSFTLVSGTVQEERVAFVRPTSDGGDVDAYSISPALPTGLTFNTETGRITGTPTAVGSAEHTITATNGEGSSSATITISVVGDTEPAFGSDSDIADQAYIAGKHRVNLTLPEATGGNAPLVYSLASTLPEGLTLDPAARTITGIPELAMGSAVASVYVWTVTDTDGDVATKTFEISVSANSVPQFSSPSPPKTITLTQGISYSGMTAISLSEATGGNGSPVYTLTPEPPSGLTFSAGERTITGTPDVAGTTTHTYTATDSGDPVDVVAAEDSDAVTQAITVIVEPNTVPMFEVASITLGFDKGVSISEAEGSELPPVSGGNGMLVFAFGSDLPDGLLLSSNGKVFGLPTVTGTTVRTYTVTDAEGDSDMLAVTIIVDEEVNPGAPRINGGPVREVFLDEGITVVATVQAVDPDGDALTYTLGGADAGLFWYDASSGVLSFNNTPDFETPESTEGSNVHTVILTASDGTLSDMQTITVHIRDTNEAPTDISLSSEMVSSDATAGSVVGELSGTDEDTGNTYVYSLTAGDGDGDNVLFEIDSTRLKIRATPAAGIPSYNIRINVHDGANDFSKAFTVTVREANEAPTDISLSATMVSSDAVAGTVVGELSTTDEDTGNTYVYALTAGDGDVDNALFEVDGTRLKIRATPVAGIPSYNIRVNVNDGANDFSKAFTLTVTSAPLSAKDAVTTGISIYPNAATEVIYISNVVGQATYTLSDIDGKMLKTGILKASKTAHSLDISPLKTGVYLLEITTGRTSSTRRVVKQ